MARSKLKDPDYVQRLESLVLEGKSRIEISEALQSHTETITRNCQKLGLNLISGHKVNSGSFQPSKDWSVEVEIIRQRVEVEGLQHWKVAEELNIQRRQVSELCKKFGIKTQRSGPRSGDGHTNWKGGRVSRDGYIYIYMPDHPNAIKAGYVLEHRLVMESHIGRILDKKEVVHHKDQDSSNNQIDNLELFSSNAEHLKHELTGSKWSEKRSERNSQRVLLRKHSHDS